MRIYIGSDHRGFKLKEHLKTFLQKLAYPVIDLGNAVYNEGDDYPKFAAEVARRVAQDLGEGRGIVICGSGVGVSIVANKVQGIRAALALTADVAHASRAEDDVNVLALAADFTPYEDAERIASVWLQTPFSLEERHRRRLDEIRTLELGHPLD